MSKVMKRMNRQGAGGLLKSLMGGGIPGQQGQAPPEDIASAANLLNPKSGAFPRKLPGLGSMNGLPPNFPFGKKK